MGIAMCVERNLIFLILLINFLNPSFVQFLFKQNTGLHKKLIINVSKNKCVNYIFFLGI